MKETKLIQSVSALFRNRDSEAPLADPAAFDALYESSYRSVYRYIYGLRGGPAEDVEDLTVETFYRAWKARRSFSGDPQNGAVGWLLIIARHLTIDDHRRNQAHPWPQDELPDETPHSAPAPEAMAVANEQQALLLNQLRRLPLQQREMLTLRYLLEWRVQQIAEYLDLPENTVSVTLHRALTRLQRDWPREKEQENV